MVQPASKSATMALPMTRRQVVTSLTAFRARIGKPIERWRAGIYALLVTKPKRGKVLPLKRKVIGCTRRGCIICPAVISHWNVSMTARPTAPE
jgi:hypothetical protein